MSAYFSVKRFFYLALGGVLLYFSLEWSLAQLQGSLLQLHFGQDVDPSDAKLGVAIKAFEGSFYELFLQYAPNSLFLGSVAFVSTLIGAWVLFHSRNQKYLHGVLHQIFALMKAMPAVLLVLFVLLIFAAFELSAPYWLSLCGACAWGLHSSFGLFRFFLAQVRWEEKREYVITALAKGLTPQKVFYKHILKNILPWLLLYLAQLLGGLLTGVFLLEIVLDLPGLGYLLNQAIRLRDTALVCNLVLMLYFVEVLGLSLTLPRERAEFLP